MLISSLQPLFKIEDWRSKAAKGQLYLHREGKIKREEKKKRGKKKEGKGKRGERKKRGKEKEGKRKRGERKKRGKETTAEKKKEVERWEL